MAFQIGLLFLLKHKITLFYLLSFAFLRFITRCHSLSPIIIFCYLLSFCYLLYHSLSLVVTCCITRCHSLYHSMSFVVTRCHSMSLDVPLVCLFINDNYFIIFCFLHLLQYFVAEVRRDGGRGPRIRAEGRGSRNTNTFFSRNQ